MLIIDVNNIFSHIHSEQYLSQCRSLYVFFPTSKADYQALQLACEHQESLGELTAHPEDYQ